MMSRKLWPKTLWLALGILPFFAFEGASPLPAPDSERNAADYPKDYFQAPIATEVHLTGTFGELRSNHYHAGLDIDGKIDVPVYAAADGYVSNIKVQGGSYGNVLYIKHPNGYTTLYGHLDHFAPEIAQYVREIQYKKERFEVDLRLPETKFRVKKGQEIARMGNSGASTGPHLHFEIRNSTTQRVLNPLLFGIPVQDNIAPEIRDMKVYFLNEKREVMGSKPFPIKKQKDGTYSLEGDTVRIGGWRVGFGVKAYDSMTGFRNDNGIYDLSMYTDDQLAFEWRMDELDFDQSRYINAHIDYAAERRYGAWFHRCFVLPGDRLINYKRTESMGAVSLYEEKPVKITINATDAAGNATAIHFWALRDAEHMETFEVPTHQFELPSDTESRIELEDFHLTMPKGALYETLPLQYSSTPSNAARTFSNMHHVQNGLTPVQRYYEIGIKPINLPPELKNKAVIALCGSGRPDNCGAAWNGAFLTTKVREFGDYCVMIDTTPPTIMPIVFNKDMRKNHTMAFRISDNMAVNGLADGLYFRGTIDGKWALFEYDKKRARITYNFDEQIGRGEHKVRIVVQDDRGNEGKFERSFLR
ncbi:MAG: M23 family metallopeptidase [Bacteroidota bacterium]